MQTIGTGTLDFGDQSLITVIKVFDFGNTLPVDVLKPRPEKRFDSLQIFAVAPITETQETQRPESHAVRIEHMELSQ